jgi:hypothetical protein
VCACAPLRHWRGSSRAFLYTAVWCQLFDEQRQTWTKAHLIVATESGLDAPTIVQLYARRWGIEPLVHNLKRWWGLNHLWQHTRIVLELRIQIRSCAWSLMQLLSLAVADATQCASSETVTRCAQPSACVRSSFHRVARFIAHYHTVSARVTAGCLKFST